MKNCYVTNNSNAKLLRFFLLDVVSWGLSVKELFLKLSQNPQEKTCAGISIVIKKEPESMQLFLKKRLRHGSFSVNFGKFFRNPILQNICKQLVLFLILKQYACSFLIYTIVALIEKSTKNEILQRRFDMKWVINFKDFYVYQSFEPL